MYILSYKPVVIGDKSIKYFLYQSPEQDDNLFVFDLNDFNIPIDSSSAQLQYSALTTEYKLNQPDSFEWERLNEIFWLLKLQHYKAALLLALTIPDICSKIEFPDEEDLGIRYQKWFDNNVSSTLIGEHGGDNKHFDCVNGYFTYQLRCKLIHGDSIDIEEVVNRPQSSFISRDQYQRVIFRFYDKEYSEIFEILNEDDEKFIVIFHSVPQLIKTILCAAEKVYQNTNNKNLFYDGCFVQTLPRYQKFDWSDL